MPRSLSINQFECLTGSNGYMSAEAFLRRYGFELETCQILVRDDGVLTCTQEEPWLMRSFEPGEWAEIKEREERGHTYRWHDALKFWHNTDSRAGRTMVQIFTPSSPEADWWVVVPRLNIFTNFRGDNAEEQCFASADAFITWPP